MTRDHNLLFGVFAVQLGKVSAIQIMDVAAAWALDTSRDIPSRLVELKILGESDRRLLERFVQEAVAAHNGDVEKTLVSFGGEEQVHQTYRGSIVLTKDGQVSIPPTARTPDGESPSLKSDDVSTVRGVFETPGRYTNSIEHARGGMGRVLLVHDDFLGRDIALKELLPHLGETEHRTTLDRDEVDTDDLHPSPVRFSAHILARFLQEARITGQLEHPSIVPVYELGHRRDGSLYYTMKLVRGRSLSKAIKECKNLEERLRLLPHFVDLCQAIAYAHSREIIHRDIKPANVMVGEFGETVVLDWGLAKKRDREDVHEKAFVETLHAMNLGEEAEAAKTAYGQVLGTPVYMAPEQAQGDLDAVDEQSDVYALGIVLYEILTGQVPVEGKSTREILNKVIAGELLPVGTFEERVPPELAAILEKASRRDKKTRYRDAASLAEEIERFQSGAAVSAYGYNVRDQLKRLYKRYQAVILPTAAALLLLIIGAGVFVFLLAGKNVQLHTALEGEQLALQDNMRLTEETEKRLYRSSIILAQSRLRRNEMERVREALLAAPHKYRGWEWGYLMSETTDFVELEESDAIGRYDRFEVNEGTNRVFGQTDRLYCVWQSSGGRLLSKTAIDAEATGELVWDLDPQGRYRISGRKSGELVIQDAETLETVSSIALFKNPVEIVRISSGGTYLIAGNRLEPPKVVDMETLEIRSELDLSNLSSFVPSDPEAKVEVVTCFNEARKLVFVAVNDRNGVWDLESGSYVYSVTNDESSENVVESADFSSDGKLLAVSWGEYWGTITVHSSFRGRVISVLEGAPPVAFDSTGYYLSCGGGPPIKVFERYDEDLFRVAWERADATPLIETPYSIWSPLNPGGEYIVAEVSDDIHFMRLEDGESLGSISNDVEGNYLSYVSLSGSSIITPRGERPARLWNLVSRTPRQDFQGWLPIAFGENSRSVLFSSIIPLQTEKGGVVWGRGELAAYGFGVSLTPERSFTSYKQYDGTIQSAVSLAGNRDVVLLTDLGTILYWPEGADAPQWVKKKSENRHALKVAGSPSGEQFTVLFSEGRVELYSRGNDVPIAEVTVTVEPISLAYVDDGSGIAVGLEDGSVDAWDAELKNPVNISVADSAIVDLFQVGKKQLCVSRAGSIYALDRNNGTSLLVADTGHKYIRYGRVDEPSGRLVLYSYTEIDVGERIDVSSGLGEEIQLYIHGEARVNYPLREYDFQTGMSSEEWEDIGPSRHIQKLERVIPIDGGTLSVWDTETWTELAVLENVPYTLYEAYGEARAPLAIGSRLVWREVFPPDSIGEDVTDADALDMVVLNWMGELKHGPLYAVPEVEESD